MSKHGPYLTRGRRRAFNKCQHRGFGAFCHRCDQADKITKKVETLSKLINLKDAPKDVAELLGRDTFTEGTLRVAAETVTFYEEVSPKKGFGAAVRIIADKMIHEAARLSASTKVNS